jgi:hypothetical protein
MGVLALIKPYIDPRLYSKILGENLLLPLTNRACPKQIESDYPPGIVSKLELKLRTGVDIKTAQLGIFDADMGSDDRIHLDTYTSI